MYDVQAEVIYNSERHSIRLGVVGHTGAGRERLKEILLPKDVYIDD